MNYKQLTVEQLRTSLETMGRGLHALCLEGVKAKDPAYKRQYGYIRRLETELARRGHPVVKR